MWVTQLIKKLPYFMQLAGLVPCLSGGATAFLLQTNWHANYTLKTWFIISYNICA